MKKPKKTTLKKKLEKLVAQYVKQRDGNICQKCLKYVEGANCHASHVIPKSMGNQFRFDPLNLKVLCFKCHIGWWHKEPVRAGEWFKEKFPDRYEYLYGQPRKTAKFSVEDYQEMIEHYKSLLE